MGLKKDRISIEIRRWAGSAAWAVACLFVAVPTQAGSIPAPLPSLNSIFAQASFGTQPISINWLPAGTPIANSALLTLDSDTEVTTLFNLAVAPFPFISVFFVDRIRACGGAGSFIGCTDVGERNIVVESAFAAGPQGSILVAHEVGHSLGLFHEPGLMNFTVTGNTDLTPAQVTAIRQSNLVQGNVATGFFITLQPIAVVASVPEPGIHTLMVAGLLLLGVVARRSKPLPGMRGYLSP